MENAKQSLSTTHASVINLPGFLNKKSSPLECVYIIDGVYIGATNDLKRRIREYIGRAIRNEKSGSETPVMAHIKRSLAAGNKIKFCVISNNPLKEGFYIQRMIRRGIKLINDTSAPDYSQCYSKQYSFYERKRIKEGKNAW